MVKALFFSAGEAIYEVSQNKGSWRLQGKEVPHGFRCLAADPSNEGRLYGGTFDHGLWISDDYGESWRQAGEGITHPRVLSVAVSPIEKVNGHHVVWAGTEPSELFRSEDGGDTWTSCPNLPKLPSRSEWSFPPRPHTHHVRWIQPDIHQPNRIFSGIELGGVMRSEDKGETWEDRKPGSQYDCHTMTMTTKAADRIYEAAGGGFAESLDGGKTWQTKNEGLDPYTYLVEIAVDSGNPDTIIASAAKSARTAYMPERAHSVLMRKEAGAVWEVVSEGLPNPDGASVFTLLADEEEPGVFFAVNNLGVYQSQGGGKTWNKLPVDWPEYLCNQRIWSLTSV